MDTCSGCLALRGNLIMHWYSVPKIVINARRHVVDFFVNDVVKKQIARLRLCVIDEVADHSNPLGLRNVSEHWACSPELCRCNKRVTISLELLLEVVAPDSPNPSVHPH